MTQVDECIVELREQAHQGQPVLSLLRLFVNRLGDDARPFLFDHCFHEAFNVPLEVLRNAENWRGLGNPGGLSDAEVVALLEPFIDGR